MHRYFEYRGPAVLLKSSISLSSEAVKIMSDRAAQDYSVALLPAHPKSSSSLHPRGTRSRCSQRAQGALRARDREDFAAVFDRKTRPSSAGAPAPAGRRIFDGNCGLNRPEIATGDFFDSFSGLLEHLFPLRIEINIASRLVGGKLSPEILITTAVIRITGH